MKSQAIHHPKMRALARALNIPHPMAVGIMEMLWHFAVDHAPHGDIGRFPDEEIAEAVGWPRERDPADLILVLERQRWLDAHPDCRYIIHDWPQHCADYAHRKVARSCMAFASGDPPNLSCCTRLEREKWNTTHGCQENTRTFAEGSLVLRRRTNEGPMKPTPHLTSPHLTQEDVRKTSSARKTPDSVARAPADLPPMAQDDGYCTLRAGVEALVPEHTYTADGWASAYQHWRRLDPEQREIAAANYIARIEANGDDLTYLKPQLILRGREWQRRPVERANSRQRAEREIDAMIARAEREGG